MILVDIIMAAMGVIFGAFSIGHVKRVYGTVEERTRALMTNVVFDIILVVVVAMIDRSLYRDLILMLSAKFLFLSFVDFQRTFSHDEFARED